MKIRSYWIYNHTVKDKSEQVLEIEGMNFKCHEIMKDIDKCVSVFLKKKLKFAKKGDEIKEIMENFLIEVQTKGLVGGLE